MMVGVLTTLTIFFGILGSIAVEWAGKPINPPKRVNRQHQEES